MSHSRSGRDGSSSDANANNRVRSSMASGSAANANGVRSPTTNGDVERKQPSESLFSRIGAAIRPAPTIAQPRSPNANPNGNVRNNQFNQLRQGAANGNNIVIDLGNRNQVQAQAYALMQVMALLQHNGIRNDDYDGDDDDGDMAQMLDQENALRNTGFSSRMDDAKKTINVIHQSWLGGEYERVLRLYNGLDGVIAKNPQSYSQTLYYVLDSLFRMPSSDEIKDSVQKIVNNKAVRTDAPSPFAMFLQANYSLQEQKWDDAASTLGLYAALYESKQLPMAFVLRAQLACCSPSLYFPDDADIAKDEKSKVVKDKVHDKEEMDDVSKDEMEIDSDDKAPKSKNSNASPINYVACREFLEQALALDETCEEAYILLCEVSRHTDEKQSSDESVKNRSRWSQYLDRWAAAVPKSKIMIFARALFTERTLQRPKVPEEHVLLTDVPTMLNKGLNITPAVTVEAKSVASTVIGNIESLIVDLASNVIPKFEPFSLLFHRSNRVLQRLVDALEIWNKCDVTRTSVKDKRAEDAVCAICLTSTPTFMVWNPKCCHVSFCNECVTTLDPMCRLRQKAPFCNDDKLLPPPKEVECPWCRQKGQIAMIRYN